MKRIKIAVLLFLGLLMFSCASKKDIIYLQDVNVKNNVFAKDSVSFKAPVFKSDDRITINISSVNPEAAKPFNLYLAGFNTGGLTAVGQQQQQSYLVDKNGFISFPQLGRVKVSGLSRIELQNYLEEKIKPYLPDVKAIVQLVNFRISILGEVSRPGEYIIDRDKISILQAIGLAGDLTIHGKRDEVKVVREVEGVLTYYNIDLRSKEFMNSPGYYLQQNDVLYIPPNQSRVNAAISSPTNSYIISATGLLITIISILF